MTDRTIPPPPWPRRACGSLLLGIAALLATLGTAQAQVNRCVDGDGRVVYTDADCPADSQAEEILPARTGEEIEADRQRAEEAAQRQRERQQAELEARRMRAEIDALEATAQAQARNEAAAQARPIDYEATTACRDARRRLDRVSPSHGRYSEGDWQRIREAQDQVDRACLGPDAYADIQRQRAVQPPPALIVVPSAAGHPGWTGRPPGIGHPPIHGHPPHGGAKPPVRPKPPPPAPPAENEEDKPAAKPPAERGISVPRSRQFEATPQPPLPPAHALDRR